MCACTPAPAQRTDSARADSSPIVSPAVAPPAAPPAAQPGFHAVGQEPGWLLDVVPGREIRYVGDYGDTRVTTPAPTPTVDADGTITYRAQTDGTPARSLTVIIRPTPCQDARSGAPYSHTVTVRLGEREVRGCGKSVISKQ
jgi:putative lipoprotein